MKTGKNDNPTTKNPLLTALITGCFNGLSVFIFSQFIKWDCVFCILFSNLFSFYIVYQLFKNNFTFFNFLRFSYAQIIGLVFSAFSLSGFSRRLNDRYLEFAVAAVLIIITINGIIFFVIRSQMEKEEEQTNTKE